MTNILVNLPETFFEQEELKPIFERLNALGDVRTSSHNTPDEIREDLGWAEAVVMWSWPMLDDELLDAAPNLSFCGNIDISQEGAKIALRRGLAVSQSRHGWSPAVAEMALTLMLTTLRRVSDYHMQMRHGEENWVQVFPADIDARERELTGRSVGIVGFGGVGRRLAELLVPFRCELHVSDPFVDQTVIDRFGASRVELNELIESSDVVVLSAASNEGTRKLIGPEQIAKMRENAVFINVARAALVDTDSLIERLRQGDLFAALDVFDQEPLEADHPLRQLPNAYLTPHRAGGLMASVERCVGWLVDDLERHLAGEERRHPLTETMILGLDG